MLEEEALTKQDAAREERQEELEGRWEIAHSYRVPGRIVTEQNLIEFDLRQAIQLERKETNTAATEKNAG